MKNDRATIQKQINSLAWTHSIKLPGGIVTPGRWGLPRKEKMDLFDTINFKGKSVLDIGCWDGLWSFEAEKRGATTIYATDDVSQCHNDQSTFEVARNILGSKAQYFPDVNVYDIDRIEKKNFDIILYFGVYYHLKHPLYALSKLRKMLKEGGLLLIEGPAFMSERESFAKFYYRGKFAHDESNWWVPSLKCLREMVECSFFKITNEIDCMELKYSQRNLVHAMLGKCANLFLNHKYPKRYLIQAEAVERVDYNYIFPDQDLSDFDQKTYDDHSQM